MLVTNSRNFDTRNFWHCTWREIRIPMPERLSKYQCNKYVTILCWMMSKCPIMFCQTGKEESLRMRI